MPIGDPSYCYKCGRDCKVNGEVSLNDEATGKLIINLEYATCRWCKGWDTRRERKAERPENKR